MATTRKKNSTSGATDSRRGDLAASSPVREAVTWGAFSENSQPRHERRSTRAPKLNYRSFSAWAAVVCRRYYHRCSNLSGTARRSRAAPEKDWRFLLPAASDSSPAVYGWGGCGVSQLLPPKTSDPNDAVADDAGWDPRRREIIGCVFSPLVFFLLLSAAVVFFFFFLPNMDAWYELKGTPGSDELLIGHGRLF